MALYHGSDQIIKTPEVCLSVRTLDFGQGFYTTTNKEQAIDFQSKFMTGQSEQEILPMGSL